MISVSKQSLHRFERKSSLEELLIDLYDRRPLNGRYRLDSDTCTDVSALSDSSCWRTVGKDGRHAYTETFLAKMGVDAKLQFTPDPPPTENGYEQWLNAMKAVARLPDGMPSHFRQKLWLTLADHYVKTAQIDWEETKRWAFNDRMNPDDDELSLQIVKDLHRTGWSGLDGDKERVLLRRVLLAYARYNKTIGYCQGFNVIAALILEVAEYREEQALKVMIMLIENVLPSGYFDQTLRALSVDMAVLRDLMHIRLPKLSTHLDYLQESSDSEFEPPLINVFSMQWFLTLFATCFPKHAVHRVWDSLMLEGSEVLLRAALALWAKIGKRVYRAKSADAFYSLMGTICQELTEMTSSRCDELMNVIYTMAEFPYPGLDELRDKHMWNIQPFSTAFRLLRQQAVSILKSDTDEANDSTGGHYQASLSKTGSPNFDGDRSKFGVKSNYSATDLGALEKQYKLLRQRQKQAAIILQNAITKGKSHFPSESSSHGEKSEMFNHLYLNDGNCKRSVAFNGSTLLPVAPKAIQPSGRAKRDIDRSRRTSSASSASTKSYDDTCSSTPTTPTPFDLRNNRGTTAAEYAVRVPLSLENYDDMVSAARRDVCRRSRSVDDVFDVVRMPASRKYRSCIELGVRSCDEPFVASTSKALESNNENVVVAKKKKFRPPPLVLGSASATAQVPPVRKNSSAETKMSAKRSATLEKSKAILNSFPQESSNSPFSATNSVGNGVYNPFPTKRQTTLIERGKRLGLYS